jgi:L-amino acid N-acyltransferase YncA
MTIVRFAEERDLEDILNIYNQGIVDRIATLESETKDIHYMSKWLHGHSGRYRVFVAELNDTVIGWASLHPYSQRRAYAGVGELSVYIRRDMRGNGIGQQLLTALEQYAKGQAFHKLVLGTFPFNQGGQGLYHKMGFYEVGTFKNHGRLDGNWVDVMWMEKLIL